MKIIILFVIFGMQLCLIHGLDCDKNPKTMESQIKHAILCDYDTTQGPNGTTAISLEYLVRNFDLSEQTQTLTLRVWLKFQWNDQNLKWDDERYKNIKKVTVSSTLLWLPDMAVYNSIDGSGLDKCEAVSCEVWSSGNVKCVVPCTHDALCNTDYKRWPYDRQNCTLELGSWVAGGVILNYIINGTSEVQLQGGYVSHKEFIMQPPTFRYQKDAFTDSFIPYFIFSFVLDRYPGQHAIVLGGPCIVMVFINLVAVWINLECSHRLTLLMFNTFLHYNFIYQFFWYIPFNGENVPDLFYYFRDSLIMTAILLFGTVIARGIAKFQMIAPQWIELINNLLITNPVGLYFDMNSFEDNNPLNNHSGDDDQSLVSPTKPEMTKENIKWRQFSKIIDRLLFVIFVIAYAVMYIRLLLLGGY